VGKRTGTYAAFFRAGMSRLLAGPADRYGSDALFMSRSQISYELFYRLLFRARIRRPEFLELDQPFRVLFG
jgi:hypothetical protein